MSVMLTIVGVAYPVYPTSATSRDERAANARCKTELLARFPGAGIRYHGRLDKDDANAVKIGFLAAVASDSSAAIKAVTAADGKRPTLGREFKGAVRLQCTATVTLDLDASFMTAEVTKTKGPTVQEMATMKMADLVEWARILEIKVNKTGSKVDARNAITAFLNK